MRSLGSVWSLLLIFMIFFVSGQLIQSVYAEYKELNLKILVSQNNAKVVEEINPRTIVSTITVQAVSSNILHVLATDQDNTVLVTSQDGNQIRIDTLGASHVTLTYDANIVTRNSGVWAINYNSSNIDSTIILPPISDIVFVNNIPNDINGDTVTMPAGQVSISYITRTVSQHTFSATLNGINYPIEVITASKLEKFNFDQNSKSVIMTLDDQAPALVILPKSLIGGQYFVTLNDKPVQFKDYYQNTTHSWIRIDPTGSGTIKITGTTVTVPEFLSIPVLIFAVSMIVSMLIISRRFSWLKSLSNTL